MKLYIDTNAKNEATVEYLKEVRDWLKDETDADRIADILTAT